VEAQVGRWGLMAYWCLQHSSGKWCGGEGAKEASSKCGEGGSKCAKKTRSGLMGTADTAGSLVRVLVGTRGRGRLGKMT
jgi:hypothetical protein